MSDGIYRATSLKFEKHVMQLVGFRNSGKSKDQLTIPDGA